MRLAVCDYAHRSFEKVVGAIDDAATSLGRASRAAGIILDLDVGAVQVVAPGIVAIPVRWRTPDGTAWFEGEVRILAVNRGTDAVTELLLVGEAAREGELAHDVVAIWAHRMLAGLATLALDRPLTDTREAALG